MGELFALAQPSESELLIPAAIIEGLPALQSIRSSREVVEQELEFYEEPRLLEHSRIIVLENGFEPADTLLALT
jgi:hypothetical protein